MIFGHKRKINNFDPYNVFLAIAINIPQRLKTAFVLQGHVYTIAILKLFNIVIKNILHCLISYYNVLFM